MQWVTRLQLFDIVRVETPLLQSANQDCRPCEPGLGAIARMGRCLPKPKGGNPMCTKLPTYDGHVAEQIRTVCNLGPRYRRDVERILGTWLHLQRSGEGALNEYLRRRIIIPRGELSVGELYLVVPQRTSLCHAFVSIQKQVDIVGDDVWLREVFPAEALASYETRVRQRLATSAQ
jgi:hypothetical protein